MSLNYESLPEGLREGTKRYIEQGVQPGSFLTSVICNDLLGAFNNADATNRARLLDIVYWFYSYAPAPCWGSPEQLKTWKERGGL